MSFVAIPRRRCVMLFIRCEQQESRMCWVSVLRVCRRRLSSFVRDLPCSPTNQVFEVTSTIVYPIRSATFPRDPLLRAYEINSFLKGKIPTSRQDSTISWPVLREVRDRLLQREHSCAKSQPLPFLRLLEKQKLKYLRQRSHQKSLLPRLRP